MDKETSETFVKIYAVLAWVGAVFSVLGAFALLFAWPLFGGMMKGYNMMGLSGVALGTLAGVISVLAGIVTLALAVLYFFVGRGLWNHDSWARIATIVLSVLALFSFPIGTIIGGFGIYLFAFDDGVKRLFK